MDDWALAKTDIEVRNQLASSYLPLVRYVASQIRTRLPAHVDLEDLISYGSIGLLEAVERYDPDRGVKFTTFAVQRIRGSILDELRAQDWAPRRVRRVGRDIAQAVEELGKDLQREPTLAELANELQTTPEALTASLAELQRSNHLTLDLSWNEDTEAGSRTHEREGTLADVLGGDGGIHEETYQNEYAHKIACALRRLDAKERIVVALYYFEDHTFSQISSILGVTESRIFQVHSSAMSTIRMLTPS